MPVLKSAPTSAVIAYALLVAAVPIAIAGGVSERKSDASKIYASSAAPSAGGETAQSDPVPASGLTQRFDEGGLMPTPSYTGQPGEAGVSASPESLTPEQKAPPKKKRRGETQPMAREVTGKKIKKKPKKQKKRKHPKEPGKKKEQKKGSHVVDKLVDKLLPGSSKYIPDWAKPIVFDVKGKSVEPDKVEAFVAQDGSLVVHAVMDPAKSGKAHGGVLGGLTVSFEENGHDEELDGVEMLLTVEDPSKATKQDPAQVEVTAVDPETEETVTTTADVTKPQKAEHVIEKAIDKTVTAVASEAAPATLES